MKLITTLLLLTLSLTTMAQTKPSKEETINWIVKTIKENNFNSKVKQTNETCTVNYDYELALNENNEIVVEINVASSCRGERLGDLNSVSVFNLDNICGAVIKGDFLKLNFKSEITEKSTYTPARKSTMEPRFNKIKFMEIGIDEDKYPGMKDRLLKAFSNLGSYNCSTEGEPF